MLLNSHLISGGHRGRDRMGTTLCDKVCQ